jgi:hypothetical protein
MIMSIFAGKAYPIMTTVCSWLMKFRFFLKDEVEIYLLSFEVSINEI